MIKLSSQARQWFRKATLNFPTQMLWSKTSIINHPRITPDWNSERPTLQQQLKLFSAKHTRSNKSRSPSREQSTTKSTKGSRNCKIESRNCKIKTNQTGNTSMDHTRIYKKFKLNKKSKKVDQNGPTTSKTGGQIEKIELLSVISLIKDTMRTLSNYGEDWRNN